MGWARLIFYRKGVDQKRLSRWLISHGFLRLVFTSDGVGVGVVVGVIRELMT